MKGLFLASYLNNLAQNEIKSLGAAQVRDSVRKMQFKFLSLKTGI